MGANAQPTSVSASGADAGDAATKETVVFPLAGEPALTAEIGAAVKAVGQKAKLSGLAVDEVMLALGCAQPSIACLQKIGAMINAQLLIFGTVKKEGQKKTLTLRRVDVATGADVGKSMTTLSHDPEKRARELREAMVDLFKLPKSRATAIPDTGELVLLSSMPNIEVVVNGQPRGVAPLNLMNLPEGKYSLEARRPGYRTWRAMVIVKTGRISHVQITLQRDLMPPPSKSVWRIIKPQTWILAALGVAAVGTGIGFATHMVSQQNDFDQLDGATGPEVMQMQELKDTGERDALVANVLFGVGGGLLLTAVILTYFDFRGESAPREEAAFTPHFSLGLTSVQLHMSF
ncbi:MAG: PEGA domain-containing protein [Deltaproteobacteria bacterium]|nr:PEGA domain-containing protein [Deltaproteobacteria bacterium]